MKSEAGVARAVLQNGKVKNTVWRGFERNQSIGNWRIIIKHRQEEMKWWGWGELCEWEVGNDTSWPKRVSRSFEAGQGSLNGCSAMWREHGT